MLYYYTISIYYTILYDYTILYLYFNVRLTPNPLTPAHNEPRVPIPHSACAVHIRQTSTISATSRGSAVVSLEASLQTLTLCPLRAAPVNCVCWSWYWRTQINWICTFEKPSIIIMGDQKRWVLIHQFSSSIFNYLFILTGKTHRRIWFVHVGLSTLRRRLNPSILRCHHVD